MKKITVATTPRRRGPAAADAPVVVEAGGDMSGIVDDAHHRAVMPRRPPSATVVDMRVIAHGVDVVAIERIAVLLEAHGERFRTRVYTEGEQRYAEMSPVRRAERYAVRFAAKEAALKALGTGLRGGIHWTDIEVVASLTGAPQLILRGEARAVAQRLGIERWLVSLSHSGGIAVASAIGGSSLTAERG